LPDLRKRRVKVIGHRSGTTQSRLALSGSFSRPRPS